MVPELFGGLAGGNTRQLAITIVDTVPFQLRFGVITQNVYPTNSDHVDFLTLEQVVGGTASATIVIGGPDRTAYHFFDIFGAVPGERYALAVDSFAHPGSGAYVGLIFDSPEPTSVLMAGIGGVLLGSVRRRSTCAA